MTCGAGAGAGDAVRCLFPPLVFSYDRLYDGDTVDTFLLCKIFTSRTHSFVVFGTERLLLLDSSRLRFWRW